MGSVYLRFGRAAPKREICTMSYLATLGKLSVTKASTKTNVAVSTFYNDKPVVIYFIRRFGCAICRWSVKDYQKLVPILADKVNLVVVAPEWHGYDDFVKGAWVTSRCTLTRTRHFTRQLASIGTMHLPSWAP